VKIPAEIISSLIKRRIADLEKLLEERSEEIQWVNVIRASIPKEQPRLEKLLDKRSKEIQWVNVVRARIYEAERICDIVNMVDFVEGRR